MSQNVTKCHTKKRCYAPAYSNDRLGEVLSECGIGLPACRTWQWQALDSASQDRPGGLSRMARTSI